MPSTYTSADKQAELLKDQGNLYFKKERLAAAIEAYTEAITLCPNVATYWTNRAICHKKRNDWKRVESDCMKALELDNNSFKARYLLGLALSQDHQYGEAVKQLEKALELGQIGSANSDMLELIWFEVENAKYAEWELVAFPRLQKQKELRLFCEKALQESYERYIQNAEDADKIRRIIISDKAFGDNTSSEVSRLKNAYIEQKQTLADVFDKAAECDKPSEVPEYLCCKITMDIFRDPVITPSGVTYERAILLDHLDKVGKFDPMTRVPLEPDQLIPNLAIKEAVKLYLAEHGWAYKLN